MTTPSYVYFLFDRETDQIKIGYSDNVERRKQQIESKLGRPLFFLAVTDGGRPLEQKLHGAFAHLRGEGKWFKLAPELEQFVLFHMALSIAQAERDKRPDPFWQGWEGLL